MCRLHVLHTHASVMSQKIITKFFTRHSGRRASGEPESSGFSRHWIPAQFQDAAGMTVVIFQRTSNSRH
jgi:hypothetical protein